MSMEIDFDIKKEEVEKIVKELLEVDKGKKIEEKGHGVAKIGGRGHKSTWFLIH